MKIDEEIKVKRETYLSSKTKEVPTRLITEVY